MGLGALVIAPSAEASGSGGARVPEAPRVDRIACMALPGTRCAANGALVRGGRVVVRGRDLEATTRVLFEGKPGRGDDVAIKPRAVTGTRVEATVPRGANSGRLVLLNSLGAKTRSAQAVAVVSPPPPPAVDVAPGSAYFFAGRRKPVFRFSVDEAHPTRVELVSEAGAVVRSWEVGADPARENTVVWDGKAADGRSVSGRFRFRVAGASAASASPVPGADAGFALYDHLFPIRGRHDLGQTETNDFGGGRGHKGQDMFAACGTRVAAARGGTVKFAGYHSAAGNYVVIDAAGTDVDYVYMHMRDTPLVRTSQRVFTGQQLGVVGETGRATGCHLHFELWSAPGWYDGGSAFDPLPSLRAWDAYS